MDYQTWYRQHYLPAKAGGRPGRAGGKAQVAMREKLAKQGWTNTETVELGRHYPDMVRPNQYGKLDYAEVGAMTKRGLPRGHERAKVEAEVAALQADERLFFFDRDNDARYLMIHQTNNGISYRLFNI